jgi:hypothetical protein
VPHRQGILYEERLHYSIARIRPSGLPIPSGNGPPVPALPRIPHTSTNWSKYCPTMASGKRVNESVRVGLDKRKHFAVPCLPTREDSNPHSIAVHRPPSSDPRGFLPWGLSDACPLSSDLAWRDIVGGQASDNPKQQRSLAESKKAPKKEP